MSNLTQKFLKKHALKLIAAFAALALAGGVISQSGGGEGELGEFHLFVLDTPERSGENTLVLAKYHSTGTLDPTQVFINDTESALLNDQGSAPDVTPGDGIYTGYITLDLQKISADIDAYEARFRGLPTQPPPRVVAGRGVKELSQAPTYQVPQEFNLALPSYLGTTPLLEIHPQLHFYFSSIENPEKVFIVNNINVVNDPLRTYDPCTGAGTVNGAWSFKKLMSNMANTQISAQQFTHNWLRNWMESQFVNDFEIEAAPDIVGFFPGWDGENYNTLDMNNLPFRLLAIVNRIDLSASSTYGQGGSGEIRFVFGLVKWEESCSPGQMAVILEYRDASQSCNELKNLAAKWIALDQKPFNLQFNSDLQDITDTVTTAGVMPSRPNGSAINQVRTHDFEIFKISHPSLAQFREFNLSGATNSLVSTTIKQTPNSELIEPQEPPIDLVANPINDPTLLAFVQNNANKVLCQTYSVPEDYGDPSVNFRAASNEWDHFTFWNFIMGNIPNSFPACYQSESVVALDPANPVHMKSELRQKFSLNTCNACHLDETGTGGMHIDTLTSPAALSGFLTGISVPDPAGSNITREYNDLARRELVLEQIMTKPCLLHKHPSPQSH